MIIMEEEEEVNQQHSDNNKNKNKKNRKSNSSNSSSKSSSSNNSSPEKMKTKTTQTQTQTQTQMEESESESSPLRSPLQPLHQEKPFSSSLHLQSRHEQKEKPFSPSSPHLLLPSQQHYPQPQRQPPPVNPHYSTAMVTIDRKPHGFSNLRSPSPDTKVLPPPLPPMESLQETVFPKPPSPVIVVNRSIRDELSAVTKMDSDGEDGFRGIGRRSRERDDVEVGIGSDRKQQKQKQPTTRNLSSVVLRERSEEKVNKAALGFRVCALVFCLVSFSVMAADKTRGWAGDSFDRYKEYRYCLSVNTIGFVYASFQAYDLAYNLITEQHLLPFYIRYYFDFSMDQILTYLLMSASSSAATRVDDWQTNWGKDEFTVMASASVGMSFLAFGAFACSSLISGYNLCNHNRDNN